MRVKWLCAALANIDEIAAFIAEDDPAAARRVVQRIQAHVNRLAEHPHLGRPGRVPGTRELVVSGTPYIVPYRVREGSVDILRVLHGARRWPSSP